MDRERSEQSRTFLGSPGIHAQWESDYLNPDLDAFYDRCFDRIVERLAPSPGARILDAGCGCGFHAMRLASRGMKVVGVDFSESALSDARDTIRRFGLEERIELHHADLLALPFEDGSFEHVNCWGVLMHVPELERAMEELARVLAPGGKLVVTENNERSWHVVVWERLVRAAKWAMGRQIPRRRRSLRGIEEWLEADRGGLLVRKANLQYLVDFYAARGLRLVDRYPSQLTELYTNLPSRALKRQVYRLNAAWFERAGLPKLALGNTLIFEKSQYGHLGAIAGPGAELASGRSALTG